VLIHESRATHLLPSTYSAAAEHKRYSDDDDDDNGSPFSSDTPSEWVVMLSDDGHSSSMAAAGGGKAFLVSTATADGESRAPAERMILYLFLQSFVLTFFFVTRISTT